MRAIQHFIARMSQTQQQWVYSRVSPFCGSLLLQQIARSLVTEKKSTPRRSVRYKPATLAMLKPTARGYQLLVLRCGDITFSYTAVHIDEPCLVTPLL